jgi:hypothetical protein
MATRKRARRKGATKSAPRKRRRKSAPAAKGRARRPKSTVRGQSDSELARVFALAVSAHNKAAAARARREMKRRSQFGEFDAARFGVSPATLREATSLLKTRRRS